MAANTVQDREPPEPVAAAAGRPPRAGSGSFIARHPVVAFFVWFYSVGQALVFAPVIANAYGHAWPMQWFVIASTLIGLLLPALVITWLVEGGPGLRRLWQHVVHIRVGLGWYALALLGIPLVSAGFTALIEGWPTSASGSTLLRALWPHFLLPFLVTFLPNNWWEEVAWMGFVQTRLQSWRGPVVAALISGPLFALQHIALVVGNPVVVAAVLMVVMMALAIPFRFLTGWLYNCTGSLFLVGLLHAAGNAVAGGSGFQSGLLRSLYPNSSIAGVAHLLAFAAVGLLAVIATRGRLGYSRTAAETGTRA
jgi:membrane protease YdiL (CAAX protease family)